MKDYLANEVRNVVVLGHSNVMERITMAQQFLILIQKKVSVVHQYIAISHL